MDTILIASQSAALRAGIRALLSTDPDFYLLEDRTGSPIPFTAEEKKAILIFHEEDWDWLETILDESQYFVMVGDRPKSLQDLIRAGRPGWGVLSMRASSEALRAALLAIRQGLVVIPAGVLSSIVFNQDPRPNSQNFDGLADPLTEREVEVLAFLTQGLQNKQIALKLNISENTIKFHISSIYSKLGVSNRTEAVRRGAQLGLVAL